MTLRKTARITAVLAAFYQVFPMDASVAARIDPIVSPK